jgi:flagellar basal body P-ring protein FlgI
MTRLFYITFSFFLIVFLFSCKDDYTICNEEKNVRLSINFYQRIGNIEVAATAPDLKVFNYRTNVVVYNNQPNLSMFSLALDEAKDTTQFTLSLANNLPLDTLTFIYSSQPKVISQDCGIIYTHSIIKAYTTTNSLDSIKIINPLVNTSLVQNAKLYF